MTQARLALALVLLTACGPGPYVAPDSGCVACRDSSIRDAGTFADAYTSRLELTDPLGECLPEDEAECGCVDGFRRCDTCGWCPTGFACDEYAGVCRGEDYFNRTAPVGERNWQDGCSIVLTDGTERDGATSNPDTHYCHTGKVCGASADADGTVFKPMGGRCFPISFCQAAAEADPPLSTLHCIYSDGTDVVNGPPMVGACPVGDLRQPYCGGVCGDDLRCPGQPLYNPFGRTAATYLGSCVGFSETRSFGVCSYGVQRCNEGRDEANGTSLHICELSYGEPCACLVTHPQLDESRNVQGYVVLADVCRDYQLHFPGSTECVDAEWNPLPPPGTTTDAGSP